MLWCNAQSNTVVAGGEATGTGGSASFTAGELFYTSKSGNGLTSTDGVQQGIGANPTAVISGTNSICNGSAASLSIAFTGVGPWSGTLSDGTPFTTSNNPYSINVSPSSNTTYTVASLSDQNGTAVGADLTGSAAVTVSAVNINTTAMTACVTYTWPTNGVSYTQSGSFSVTTGCDTEILNLTINEAPSLPILACYETATFNTTTCSWDVIGSQPSLPTLACYETATFNGSTCSWDITGTQPSIPTLACYESASFNTTTCAWVVTGSQLAAPTNVVITPINGGGIIQFTEPTGTNNNISNYEYSVDNGNTWVAFSPAVTSSPLTITGLNNCSSYQVQIRAVNTCGSGIASSSITLTPVYSTTQTYMSSWTSATPPVTSMAWQSVAYGNNLFVAVAGSGTGDRVMTSPDGINWTPRVAPTNNWSGITYANGVFVAVAQSGTGNRVMTSTNGINWTSRVSAADNFWRSVTYGNNLFVAVSTTGTNNRVMTSPDGINWTARTSASNDSWRYVTYGNGTFVAVNTTGNVSGQNVMTSSNGINWTLRSTPTQSGFVWTSVTYGNGQFVALSNSATKTIVLKSIDGIIWTAIPSINNNYSSVTYGAGQFVAVGQAGTGNRVMTSPDGETWTIGNSAEDNGWNSVTYGNNTFVAVAGIASSINEKRIMSSNLSNLSTVSVLNAPVITSVQKNNNTAVIYFTQTGSNYATAATNYEYSFNNGISFTALSPASTTSPLSISNLPAGTNQFVIRAVNSVGNSCASNNFINNACITSSFTETISACGSLLWHDTTYTASNNTATWTGVNAQGCDSVVTLNLTIIPQPAQPTLACYQTATFNNTTCAWDVTGSPAATIVTIASECDSYTWSANGTAYTQSGTYNYNSNCQDYTLNLTINPTASVSIAADQTTIYAGTLVTFTATTANAGTSPIYQWKLNGNNVGTNSNTYSSNNLSSSDNVTVDITPNNAPINIIASISDTVTIGSQVWTTKNLDVSTYQNGDPIPRVTNFTNWNNLTTGAYTYYNNDSASYAATYGKIYNWYAVTDPRGLAPAGYHVPSQAEYQTLITAVGPNSNPKLKSTTGWQNGNGTNSSGWNGLAGGGVDVNGGYAMGTWGIWWTTNQHPVYSQYGMMALLDANSADLNIAWDTKSHGVYVRCIKNSIPTTVVDNSNLCTTSVTSNSASVIVNTVNTTTAIGCGSYTWSVNGQTYTTSGSYSSVNGSHTEILNLTINTPPSLPTLACYETATFNTTTCVWDVTGSQPALPTLACYETATFNTTDCKWDVTGSQPSLPTLVCYETATFNTTSCVWDVTGTQPLLPTLACYETATFNTTTCSWDITGSPAAPIVTIASECDSYTWSANGTAYTQSGTYSYFADCQDYTLNLTITPATAYYKDTDGDGYGVASSILYSCNGVPSGYAALTGDCDNNNSAIHPGATEICGNGIDDNCDGNIDEDCACTNPPTANAGSNTNVCEGSTVSLNGSIGGSASNATWTTSGTGIFTPSANVLNATYVPSANDIAAGTVTLTLTSNAVAPCTAASSSVVITFTPLPAATGAITGQANLCQPGLNPYFYSVTPVAGASSYIWTIPTGTVFDGDSTTSTVLVKYIDSYVQTGIAGNITVTPVTSTGCGSSSSSSLFVQAQIKAPVRPPSISGPQSVCNGDIATYSIANVARATSYIWTMPNGASIIGGAGTNIISVSYDATFTGGNITVASSNGCGTSAVRTRTILRNVLGAPGVITGPKDGLCGVSNVIYSIAAITGVSSYAWTVPAGASIVGSSISNSITVNFSSLFTTGNITVASVNACGTGTARTLAVKAVPGQPASITGATTVCTLSSQTYSIQSVTGASSYVWTIPGGGTITSGQGSKIINMTYGPTPSANGIVTVKASNACGVSAVKVLAVVSNNCPRVVDATSLSMIAYPNPANSILTVEFTAEQSQSVNMTMRDAAGRVVYNESKSSTKGVNTTTIDVSVFSKGVYLLQMQSDINSEVIRIIVE
jgi:uncharacterized protein (TIGR02145 family)